MAPTSLELIPTGTTEPSTTRINSWFIGRVAQPVWPYSADKLTHMNQLWNVECDIASAQLHHHLIPLPLNEGS